MEGGSKNRQLSTVRGSSTKEAGISTGFFFIPIPIIANSPLLIALPIKSSCIPV